MIRFSVLQYPNHDNFTLTIALTHSRAYRLSVTANDNECREIKIICAVDTSSTTSEGLSSEELEILHDVFGE
jgi:hypothetical protein